VGVGVVVVVVVGGGIVALSRGNIQPAKTTVAFCLRSEISDRILRRVLFSPQLGADPVLSAFWCTLADAGAFAPPFERQRLRRPSTRDPFESKPKSPTGSGLLLLLLLCSRCW